MKQIIVFTKIVVLLIVVFFMTAEVKAIENSCGKPGVTWCQVGSPMMVKRCLNDLTVSTSEFECDPGSECVNGKCEFIKVGCVTPRYGGKIFSPGQKVCVSETTYMECQANNQYSEVKSCGENQICDYGLSGYRCVNKDTTCIDYEMSNKYSMAYYSPGEVLCKSDNSYVKCLDNNTFSTEQNCDVGSLCYAGKGCVRNGGCLNKGGMPVSDGVILCDESDQNNIKTCFNSQWSISKCPTGEKCDIRWSCSDLATRNKCVKTVDKCTWNGVDYKVGDKRCSEDARSVITCLNVGWDCGESCNNGMKCFIGGVCQQNSCNACGLTNNRKKEGDADCDGKIKINDFEKWRRQFVDGTQDPDGWTANFGCIDKPQRPDIGDFETWRRFYVKELI